MKVQIWEQNNLWGWSIFDEYEDEVAASICMFLTKQEAREEAYAALSDFEGE